MNELYFLKRVFRASSVFKTLVENATSSSSVFKTLVENAGVDHNFGHFVPIF